MPFASAKSGTWLEDLQHLFHARGVTVLVLAILVGVIAGALVTLMSWAVQMMHQIFFGLGAGARLSALASLPGPASALVPALGGVLIGLSFAYTKWRGFRTPVDPIEANALHGGRMSTTDTVIVATQTVVSSGFGASVGLEAAYTQAGSGCASVIARWLKLKRTDMRLLVGCGAGGAIAAAFGAPLTGAFYGFELIIGIYSMANVAPVMVAAVSASLTANYLGAQQFLVDLGQMPALGAEQYLPYLVLGLIAGVISIVIMRLVTSIQLLFGRLAIAAPLRPAIGGLLVGALALITPHVLSSGHGAIHRELVIDYGLAAVSMLFVLKIAASAISIGSGFRGGLFFASLMLGTLLGKLFAETATLIAPALGVDLMVAAMVGMTSLAVGIVGGPLTMTFLALESTGNLSLTGVVLAAAVVTSVLVRETFGYSFSTWRLHLRGETIRSAYDVEWMRDLTVALMMRADVRKIAAGATVAEFRKLAPIGTMQHMVVVDDDDKYVGMLLVPELHALARTFDTTGVLEFVKHRDIVLVPSMNVQAAAEAFGRSETEELAVVDSFPSRKVIGLLTESHLLRRYAEELEKARRELYGDG